MADGDRGEGAHRPGPVEIGREIARAIEAEEAHGRAHSNRRSPLACVAYEPLRGEFALHHFVEAPADDRVRAFVVAYAVLPIDARRTQRDSLTMDDLYTLLTFAKRCALASLRRDDTSPAEHGVTALSAIDAERVDWRDVTVSAALLSYALQRRATDARRFFREASRRSDPTVAAILSRFADEPVDALTEWGYREVETSAGTALFDDWGRPYEPAVDLADVALTVCRVVERDAYRVTGIVLGTDLATVWLPGGAPDVVTRATDSLTGCVALQAALDPAAHPNPTSQHFTAFLAEAATPGDAAAIASACEAPGYPPRQALGLALGPLCCVVIARSGVEGVAPFEQLGALERFRPALATVLTEFAHSSRAGEPP